MQLALTQSSLAAWAAVNGHGNGRAGEHRCSGGCACRRRTRMVWLTRWYSCHVTRCAGLREIDWEGGLTGAGA